MTTLQPVRGMHDLLPSEHRKYAFVIERARRIAASYGFAQMATPLMEFKEVDRDDQILKHDLIHWKQYQRMGLFMYYFRYFIQLLLIRYDTMPMEMEARQHDDKDTQWNYRDKYHKENKSE